MEKTIQIGFYSWTDDEGKPHVAKQGETVDLPDREVERGDKLGAFTDSEVSPYGDSVEAAFGGEPEVDPESGVPHLHTPPEVSEEAKEPPEEEDLGDEPEQPDPLGEAYPELADDAEVSPKAPEADGSGHLTASDIDTLSGTALDNACAQAGVNVDEGGSLADGSKSAAEKRAALKEFYGVA